MAMPEQSQAGRYSVVVRVLVIIGLAMVLALFGLSLVVASNLEDPGHPQYHAGSAMLLLGVAWLAVVRGSRHDRSPVGRGSLCPVGRFVPRRGGRGLWV